MLGFDALSQSPLSDTGAPAGNAYFATLAESGTATDAFSQITTPTTIWLTGFAQEVLYADPDTISSVTGVGIETMLAEVNTVSFTGFATETLLISLILGNLVDNDGPAVAADQFTITKSTVFTKPKPPRPVLSTNLKLSQQPYTPVPTNMADWRGWNQQIARTVNGVLAGGQNVTIAEFTLKPNATSTILYATQIGATSVITLSPITQTAADDKPWASNQKQGQATITHSNSPATDRTYRVQIIA